MAQGTLLNTLWRPKRDGIFKRDACVQAADSLWGTVETNTTLQRDHVQSKFILKRERRSCEVVERPPAAWHKMPGLESRLCCSLSVTLSHVPLGLSFPVCEVGLTLRSPCRLVWGLNGSTYTESTCNSDWAEKRVVEGTCCHPPLTRPRFPGRDCESRLSDLFLKPCIMTGWNWWDTLRGPMPVQPNVYCFISVQGVLRCASAMNNKTSRTFLYVCSITSS